MNESFFVRVIVSIIMFVLVIFLIATIVVKTLQVAPADTDGVGEPRVERYQPPEVCLNGVIYYKNNSHGYQYVYTVKFKPDSTVEVC